MNTKDSMMYYTLVGSGPDNISECKLFTDYSSARAYLDHVYAKSVAKYFSIKKHTTIQGETYITDVESIIK